MMLFMVIAYVLDFADVYFYLYKEMSILFEKVM